MGPGILTRYSRQVLGGAIILLLMFAGIILYFRFRSPVGGVSPYETVNDFFEQEKIHFEIEQPVYSKDVDMIQVTLRNDTENTVVAPNPGQRTEWLLEVYSGAEWHSMRTIKREAIRWEFPAEEYGSNSGPSGVVSWNGGEQTFLCNLARYYRLPLEAGMYRIVFPEMEHRDAANLAVEFEVE